MCENNNLYIFLPSVGTLIMYFWDQTLCSVVLLLTLSINLSFNLGSAETNCVCMTHSQIASLFVPTLALSATTIQGSQNLQGPNHFFQIKSAANTRLLWVFFRWVVLFLYVAHPIFPLPRRQVIKLKLELLHKEAKSHELLRLEKANHMTRSSCLQRGPDVRRWISKTTVSFEKYSREGEEKITTFFSLIKYSPFYTKFICIPLTVIYQNFMHALTVICQNYMHTHLGYLPKLYTYPWRLLILKTVTNVNII